MYKAVIFDLDGTLANTLSTISFFANNALEKYGLSPFSEEEYKYMVGKGAKELVEKMVENNSCFDKDTYQKVYNEYNTNYDNDFTYKTTLYDGILELTDFLKKNNFITGVVSNKPHYPTCQIINKFFGENYFNEVIGQREGVALKPDPVSVLEILKKHNISPCECVYVGDTSTDMKTGKNAGAFTVGVTWGFRLRDELEKYGADLIVNFPHELISALKKSNNIL